MASGAEALSPSHQTATEEEEIVEQDLVSGGAAGNDHHEEEEEDSNDPFPGHSLPAGRPLHSTQLINAAKEGNMLVRKYERGKMVGHELVDPADYDPYKHRYDAKEEEEQKGWRPFRPLPPDQDPDPPALCVGRKGLYSMILGGVACICMSVFAFFIIIILFYLEDFGDMTVWMYGDQREAGANAPPPPSAEL